MMTGWLGNELSIDYLNFPFFSEVFELNFFIKSDQTFWIEVDYIPNITIWKGAHYDYFTIIRYKTEKIRKIWFLCSDFFALISLLWLFFVPYTFVLLIKLMKFDQLVLFALRSLSAVVLDQLTNLYHWIHYLFLVLINNLVAQCLGMVQYEHVFLRNPGD